MTLKKRVKTGKKLKMRLKDYKPDLIDRLRDPDYAAGYLEQVLINEDQSTFLLALRNVLEAAGGIGAVKEHVKCSRQSLYKSFSKEGNPTLATLRQVLKPLGLRVSVKVNEEAA